MVCSALENSFAYASLYSCKNASDPVITFALACYGTIEKENYHMQDITLLVESNCMDIDIKMPLRWYFL